MRPRKMPNKIPKANLNLRFEVHSEPYPRAGKVNQAAVAERDLPHSESGRLMREARNTNVVAAGERDRLRAQAAVAEKDLSHSGQGRLVRGAESVNVVAAGGDRPVARIDRILSAEDHGRLMREARGTNVVAAGERDRLRAQYEHVSEFEPRGKIRNPRGNFAHGISKFDRINSELDSLTGELNSTFNSKKRAALLKKKNRLIGELKKLNRSRRMNK